MKREFTIEGYTPEQILALSNDQLGAFVLCGEPLVFRAGTAQILGQFRVIDGTLEVGLAQIEGGGEGILPTLWLLTERFALTRGLRSVDWIVHALTCAKPNPKLRRVLERKGFSVRKVRGDTAAFFYRHQVPNKAPEPTSRTVTPRADARVAPVRAVAHL